MIGGHGHGGRGTGGNRGGSGRGGRGAGQAAGNANTTKKKKGGDSRKRSHTHNIPALYNAGGGTSIRSTGPRSTSTISTTSGGGSRPSTGGGGITIEIADDSPEGHRHSLHKPPSNNEVDEDTNVDEVNHFSHQLQMVQLISKNNSSKNAESFTLETLLHILQSVVSKEDHIM
jgi:hypothetical protein